MTQFVLGVGGVILARRLLLPFWTVHVAVCITETVVADAALAVGEHAL